MSIARFIHPSMIVLYGTSVPYIGARHTNDALQPTVSYVVVKRLTRWDGSDGPSSSCLTPTSLGQNERLNIFNDYIQQRYHSLPMTHLSKTAATVVAVTALRAKLRPVEGSKLDVCLTSGHYWMKVSQEAHLVARGQKSHLPG